MPMIILVLIDWLRNKVMDVFSMTTFLSFQEEQNDQLLRLVEGFIDLKSKEQDYKTNKKLLNKLVLRYSKAEKELYGLNQVKNKFLGMAAHDLRSPISAIIGLSDLMLMETDKLDAQHEEFVGIINDASKKMLLLLNDLLDISAIESGKFLINKKLQSLEALLVNRVRLSRFIAQKIYQNKRRIL